MQATRHGLIHAHWCNPHALHSQSQPPILVLHGMFTAAASMLPLGLLLAVSTLVDIDSALVYSCRVTAGVYGSHGHRA
jgi:hypothetical protein